MKKYLLLLGLLALMPQFAQADVSLDINIPGVSVHLGDQDNRGYYWDGYDWRPPQWWHEHRGGHIGDRNERGYYWDGGRWQHPQTQDGRNPFRGPQHGDQNHNERGEHANSPQHNNDNRGRGQAANDGRQRAAKQGGPNNGGGHDGQPLYPSQNSGQR
ncbi:Protein of uncharacterised function (DUF2502) [Yersinia intermedia]|uniref:DUF2502 domain-containing protein n=1 Tax=Yersinia intermedia TaxID=631 RepID=UPI0005E784C5|nr:DUF2502 domain-containing protein [Yersinia intermedia]MCB5320786.1 DUF2502 domain-containing protein [Yersinia intermedia]CNB65928.1 Protein of uncharacterised function (DUF2502) [Yersinia intermedia]CNG08413.1 Protein of uncharacterised function (DUF2502) [Yersinia intermedia]